MNMYSVKNGKWIKYGLLLGIFALFAVTRFWQLTTLPYGIHIDEAGMAYDAWCLSEYGVDRYLKSWPVYLTNLGGGQSSLYAFLCAGLFRVFGYSVWLVRLPAAAFSLLNLVFGMKLVKKVYPQSTFLPLAAGGLLTICPYFILSSRFGLDCNLMLGMSTLFLYCLVTAVQSGKIFRYVVAGFAGGLLLYTYALAYMILPLFLMLAFGYLLRGRRFSLKGWAAMAVPMGILALPLILVQAVNYFDLEEFRLGCFTITKLKRYRMSELEWFGPGKFCKALFSIFAGDFLGEKLEYNSAPGYLNLYGITVLLCLTGIVNTLRKLWKSLKKRETDMAVMIFLWFAAILFFESHIPTNVNRINGIFFTAVFLAVEGAYTLIFGLISGRGKRWMLTGIIGIYIVCFVRFSAYYYSGRYTAETYLLPYFDIPVTEALTFIEQDETLRDKETQMSEVEIYYALSTLISPYELRFGTREESCYRKYHFGGLGGIEDGCNYIVRDGFDEYCELLRAAGFTEQRYEGYSLFYKKSLSDSHSSVRGCSSWAK